MKINLLLVTIGLIAAIFCLPARAQKCLEFEPTTVTLTGTLYSKVFPGPPNYESIRHGDRKETAIILKLAKSKCTTGETMGMDGSYTGLREMQLVILDDKWWKTVRRRMGKHVVVTGTLFGAHTGHHRTKVLIQVADIRSH